MRSPSFSSSNTTLIEHESIDIDGSFRSNNSTSPLPSPHNSPRPQYQLSRDLTNLYELFSTIPRSSNNNTIIIYKDSPICFCCEREIARRRNGNVSSNTTAEDDYHKRKLDKHNMPKNKITTALYYGSNQVRKYMKRVMTKENWSSIMKEGFPCPHTKDNTKSQNHVFCTLCDVEQVQPTLRLTLTPTNCRAQDKEMYGEYQQLLQLRKKKRRGMIY